MILLKFYLQRIINPFQNYLEQYLEYTYWIQTEWGRNPLTLVSYLEQQILRNNKIKGFKKLLNIRNEILSCRLKLYLINIYEIICAESKKLPKYLTFGGYLVQLPVQSTDEFKVRSGCSGLRKEKERTLKKRELWKRTANYHPKKQMNSDEKRLEKQSIHQHPWEGQQKCMEGVLKQLF